MQYRFLDLRVSGDDKKEILGKLDSLLAAGQFVMGPEVAEFEEKIANYCARKFAVGVGSGTDALYTGLRALELKEGDEIITTSLSWIATANAIKMAGLTPVFADITEDLNICPESVKRLVSRKTRAILAVNFTGKLCDYVTLNDLCLEYGLLLIEDASQSFGAKSPAGISGSYGIFSAMSHNPMKILGGFGESGSILTDDEKLTEKLTVLRYNGTLNRETCLYPSLNSRLDTLQAGILIGRFGHAQNEIGLRRQNAEVYDSRLKQHVKIPYVTNSDEHVYYTYTIQTPLRDGLASWLSKHGIETKIQHRLPMPLHPAYLGSKGEWGNAERITSEILCLPVAGHLNIEDVNFIANKVHEFFVG